MKPTFNLDEAKLTVKRFRLISAVALATLLFGTWAYHLIEKWSWVDSFYFCVVSLTTVGYGDITPSTRFGKLFTCLYLLIGVAIIASLVNILLKGTIARRRLKKYEEQ